MYLIREKEKEVKTLYVTTIDEEFEKSRVKPFVRTRRGKLERVTGFERRGEKKALSKKEDLQNALDKIYEHDRGDKGWHSFSGKPYISKDEIIFTLHAGDSATKYLKNLVKQYGIKASFQAMEDWGDLHNYIFEIK